MRMVLTTKGEEACGERLRGCDRQPWSEGKGTGTSDVIVEIVRVYNKF
jgi:hypothetical protein